MPNQLAWIGALLVSAIAAAQSTNPPRQRAAMGRIVDVLGEPIPAATVQVIADGNLVQTTRSDGEGIYLIPRMPTASADLRIGAPSKAWQQLRWQGALTPVVRNVTLLDAARVHGRVTDKDGHPIAGADVIAVFGHDSVRTQTNSDGVYLLDAVAMGQVTINLWSDASPVQAKLHVRRDTECNLQTTDARGSYVQVFIKGLPDSLEDALVEVTTSNLALMPNGGRVPLTPDGLATFTAPSGRSGSARRRRPRTAVRSRRSRSS